MEHKINLKKNNFTKRYYLGALFTVAVLVFLNLAIFSQAVFAQTGKDYPTYQACLNDNAGKQPTDPTYNGETYCEKFPQTAANPATSPAATPAPTGTTANPTIGAQCTPPFQNVNGICLPSNPFNPNSFANTPDLNTLTVKIISWLLLSAGLVAVVYLIWGGYLYMTSAGNEEVSEKGRKAIMNALIGLVVIILAYTITTLVTNVLSGSSSGSGSTSSTYSPSPGTVCNSAGCVTNNSVNNGGKIPGLNSDGSPIQ